MGTSIDPTTEEEGKRYGICKCGGETVPKGEGRRSSSPLELGGPGWQTPEARLGILLVFSDGESGGKKEIFPGGKCLV